jgi:ABC-type uncharacterized transport system ATPase subunit
VFVKPISDDKDSIILEMRNITKKFPKVLANDRINFDLRVGEIHSILGENGAGKTTLMNILCGLYQKDAGEIFVEGRLVSIKSPRDALDLGIGMVHQISTLVSGLSVMENIMLGSKSSNVFFLEKRQCVKKMHRLINKFSLDVDLKTNLEQLSLGEKQKVELLRALYRGTRVLILDEPTSVLTPLEKKALLRTLTEMINSGDISAIVFITHKLPDVMSVSDRVTILRRGKVVDVLQTKDTNTQQLAQKMVGRDVLFDIKKGVADKGDKILEVRDLHVLSEDGMPTLEGVSLTINKGEILGLAGVSGNGQKELVAVIMGLQRADAGKILIKGQDTTNWSPRKIRALGVGYIPEDRVNDGILPDQSVVENLILGVHKEPPFAYAGFLPSDKKWFLNHNAVNEYAKMLISEYEVDTPDLNQLARKLSGGNIQRLILARELSRRPDLLLADKPTSGLDIGAQERIRRRLVNEKEHGKAILLISEDLDEIILMSDRIAVMYEGKLVGVSSANGVTKETIGAMMTGEREK